MHRIDTPDAVLGLFDDGDPLVPRLATYVDAAWANAVQENIVQVILGAGAGLIKGNNFQLYDAIEALVVASMIAHLASANPHPQYVRHDAAQALSVADQAQARANIGAASPPYIHFMGQI